MTGRARVNRVWRRPEGSWTRRAIVGRWIHRFAAWVAGEPEYFTMRRPAYSYSLDTWVYPIAFAGQYHQMAIDGFVGITKLVQLPDGGWTLEVKELDLPAFARGAS
jgi:hypothetical protein